MTKPLTLSLFVLSAAFSAHAQTNVGSGAYGFSDGVHPTFSVVIEGTDAKTVEGFWRDELKRISEDVLTKKEVIGAGALVPQVSPDTVRVLVKAEQRKGSPMLTAHVAIFTRNGWVGPDSDPKVYEAAERFVGERTTVLRRQLAQTAVDKAQNVLGNLQRQLADLKREKDRAEGNLERSQEKGAEAVQEQERTMKELDALAPKVEKQRATNLSTPNEENGKELADLLKQQERLQEKHRRALDQDRDMKKKVDEITWAMRKNVEDQERKTTEVERQQKVVDDLRAKLEAIH